MVLEGTVLNMMVVYDDLDRWLTNEAGYDVRAVGYDPYNAKEFIERWARENGAFEVSISDNPQDDEALLEEWTDSTQLQAAGYGGLL